LQLKEGLFDAAGIISPHERSGALFRLEEILTLHHVCIVEGIFRKLCYPNDRIDLIGFHGQTVLHRPQQHMTVQIGNGALLAEKTGIDVIYVMRSNDMRHSGDVAPLVPTYHAALAEKLAGVHYFPLVFVNIGGIANLT